MTQQLQGRKRSIRGKRIPFCLCMAAKWADVLRWFALVCSAAGLLRSLPASFLTSFLPFSASLQEEWRERIWHLGKLQDEPSMRALFRSPFITSPFRCHCPRSRGGAAVAAGGERAEEELRQTAPLDRTGWRSRPAEKTVTRWKRKKVSSPTQVFTHAQCEFSCKWREHCVYVEHFWEVKTAND